MRRWSPNLICRTMPSPLPSLRPDPVVADTSWSTASEIAAAVASGKVSALAVIEGALARIGERNPVLNAFTAVTAERARARAKAIDAAALKKQKLGPLAGVPFAAKNLFDVAGLATVAGSKINRAHPPARRDAVLIERLEAAGAVLVGALNMGEYAYDFTGENIHDGPSRNPHDLDRMTGGSSGGSGAAVVAVRHFRAQADIRPPEPRADVSVRGEPRSFGTVRAHDARSGAGLRRHAGLRCRRPGLRRSRGRAGRGALGPRHRRPAYRGGRRLLQGQDRGGGRGRRWRRRCARRQPRH